MTASTATPALSLLSSVAAATASIKSFLLICTVLRVCRPGEQVRSQPNSGGWRPMGPLKLSSERETTPNPPLRQGENPKKTAGFQENFEGGTSQSCMNSRVNADLGKARIPCSNRRGGQRPPH